MSGNACWLEQLLEFFDGHLALPQDGLEKFFSNDIA
jgi:hypothetical protein